VDAIYAPWIEVKPETDETESSGSAMFVGGLSSWGGSPLCLFMRSGSGNSGDISASIT
jgi:hypothetical protein